MSRDTSRFRATTIALLMAGLWVMILGIRLAHSYDPNNTTTAIGTPLNPNEITLFLPVIVGGLLSFVGGVRLSLLIRPWNMLLLGAVLLCAAMLGPAAISAHVPAMKDFSWTGPVLVPLFVGRILGFIFVSTSILRRLSPESKM
jgi:hypothetical protein